jgi:hypothetical protein
MYSESRENASAFFQTGQERRKIVSVTQLSNPCFEQYGKRTPADRSADRSKGAENNDNTTIIIIFTKIELAFFAKMR